MENYTSLINNFLGWIRCGFLPSFHYVTDSSSDLFILFNVATLVKGKTKLIKLITLAGNSRKSISSGMLRMDNPNTNAPNTGIIFVH